MKIKEEWKKPLKYSEDEANSFNPIDDESDIKKSELGSLLSPDISFINKLIEEGELTKAADTIKVTNYELPNDDVENAIQKLRLVCKVRDKQLDGFKKAVKNPETAKKCTELKKNDVEDILNDYEIAKEKFVMEPVSNTNNKEINKLKAELEQQTNLNGDLSEELNECKEELEKNEKELDDNRKILAKLENENTELKQKLKENKDAKNELEESKHTISDLEENNRAMEEEFDEKEKSLKKEIDNSKKKYENEKKSLVKKFEESKKNIAKLEDENKVLAKELEDCHNEIDELKASKPDPNELLSEAEARNKMQSKIAELEEVIEECNKKIQELEEENQKLLEANKKLLNKSKELPTKSFKDDYKEYIPRKPPTSTKSIISQAEYEKKQKVLDNLLKEKKP